MKYWAAARAAAGVSEETLPGSTLAQVLAAAGERHGPDLVTVLGVCSYLVDSQPAGTRDHADVALSVTAEVDVLPPFAGG